MKTSGWLVLALVASVSLYVESSCTHQRVKRQASNVLSNLVNSGSLTTLAPTTAFGAGAESAVGSDGENGIAGPTGTGGRGPTGTGGRGPTGTGGRGPTGYRRKFRPRSFNKFISRRRLTLSKLRNLQSIIQWLIGLDPELIPNWVQLSFHECFGSSGCNGCLDLDNPANHGLAPTFQLALQIKRILAPYMSTADFLALLGTEAAKAGAAKAGGSLNLPFSVGRQDCRYPQRDFGLPTGEITNTVALLKRQFKLSSREAVALMGAHSLGRARPENTGFDGPWDRSETTLDSGYYFVLNSDNLKAERVDNSNTQSTQWKSGGFLMLHGDLILRKQFTTSGRFDEPSCGSTNITECRDQPVTASITREFQDLSTFHGEFSKAFLKMITKSFSRLTRIE